MGGTEESRLCADQSLTLTQLGALRSLTLCEWMPACTCWQSRLPTSLESLTITAAWPTCLYEPAYR